MTPPLKNLVVLDLTRVLAGPFCTMLLADLGADVIKVERPDGGDDSRSFGPFIKGESAYFMSINRGKKSITLNLKNPQAQDIVKKLAQKADILVENFKPGVMAKLGLAYPELAKLNPRLIYAASSGFGQTGPYSSLPAYDLIIQGMGGLMSITGPDAQHPTKVGSSIADIFAGVFSCIGVLAALYSREKTGKGQMVDVSMFECLVSILENAITRYTTSGVSPQPIGNSHPSISPFSTLTSADGYINIACGNDELWAKYCRMAGLEPLIKDPRFLDNKARVNNWKELEPLLNTAMLAKKTGDWLTLLQAGGVPCGPINDMAAVLSDPHLQFRKLFLDLVHPIAGKLTIPGAPFKLSETPVQIDTPAPVLGQHTEEIMEKWLGAAPADIAALRAEGVF